MAVKIETMSCGVCEWVSEWVIRLSINVLGSHVHWRTDAVAITQQNRAPVHVQYRRIAFWTKLWVTTQNSQSKSVGLVWGSTTDLYQYSPDAVPPIHVVSYHVATDKPPPPKMATSSGLFLATIYNQSQLAERKHMARYWSINTAATAVPLSAHPSPL